MKYKSDGTKVIHINGLELVKNEPEYNGEITLKGEPYTSNKGQLSMIILWRYKISKEGKDLFRYSWQGKYQLTFERDKKQHVMDICDWIDHTHNVCCLDWEEKIDGSNIEGRRLPILSINNRMATAVEIVNLAHSLGLVEEVS